MQSLLGDVSLLFFFFFFLVSLALLLFWQKGVQFCAWMYWVPLRWFVKSTLSCPTPFSFVYCYDCVGVGGGGGGVTECIVCVSGYDPLTFSFLSFSFLIGWEFYGPNYLKC